MLGKKTTKRLPQKTHKGSSLLLPLRVHSAAVKRALKGSNPLILKHLLFWADGACLCAPVPRSVLPSAPQGVGSASCDPTQPPQIWGDLLRWDKFLQGVQEGFGGLRSGWAKGCRAHF